MDVQKNTATTRPAESPDPGPISLSLFDHALALATSATGTQDPGDVRAVADALTAGQYHHFTTIQVDDLKIDAVIDAEHKTAWLRVAMRDAADQVRPDPAYQTKPRPVQALRYSGDNLAEFRALVGANPASLTDIVQHPRDIAVGLGHASYLVLKPGDWLVLDEAGSPEVRTSEEFEARYEPIPA